MENNCVDLHEEAGELTIERYRKIILKLTVVKYVYNIRIQCKRYELDSVKI